MHEAKGSPLVPAEVAAYILAGGRSRRMGTPKSELILRGTTLVEHLARRIRAQVASVHLVMKPGAPADMHGLQVVFDAGVDTALVHGIRAALEGPGPAWRWVLACDMPGVEGAVLEGLWRVAQARRAPGACVRLSGRAECEPLPSLWHRDVAGHIRTEWGLVARNWLHHAGLAVWDLQPEDADAFVNVNTPDDWDAYRRRFEEIP